LYKIPDSPKKRRHNNYFSTFWIWETKIVLDRDYLFDPAGTFRNWEKNRNHETPDDVYWLYVSVLGFYIQALFACILVGSFFIKKNDAVFLRGSKLLYKI